MTMEVTDTTLTTFYRVGNEVQIVGMLSTWPASWKDVRQAPTSHIQLLSDPVLFASLHYQPTADTGSPSIFSPYAIRTWVTVSPASLEGVWLGWREVGKKSWAHKDFLKKVLEKNKISIQMVLVFTQGKFKCPTKLSKMQGLENSNLERPHVYFTL